MMRPVVDSVLDPASKTVTHLVSEPDGGGAVIIDPVLDFDPASGSVATSSADALIERVGARGLDVGWILETHAHADHITSAPYLAERLDQKPVDEPMVERPDALHRREVRPVRARDHERRRFGRVDPRAEPPQARIIPARIGEDLRRVDNPHQHEPPLDELADDGLREHGPEEQLLVRVWIVLVPRRGDDREHGSALLARALERAVQG